MAACSPCKGGREGSEHRAPEESHEPHFPENPGPAARGLFDRAKRRRVGRGDRAPPLTVPEIVGQGEPRRDERRADAGTPVARRDVKIAQIGGAHRQGETERRDKGNQLRQDPGVSDRNLVLPGHQRATALRNPLREQIASPAIHDRSQTVQRAVERRHDDAGGRRDRCGPPQLLSDDDQSPVPDDPHQRAVGHRPPEPMAALQSPAGDRIGGKRHGVAPKRGDGSGHQASARSRQRRRGHGGAPRRRETEHLPRLLVRRHGPTERLAQPHQPAHQFLVGGQPLPREVTVDVVLQPGATVPAHRDRQRVHRELEEADARRRPDRRLRQIDQQIGEVTRGGRDRVARPEQEVEIERRFAEELPADQLIGGGDHAEVEALQLRLDAVRDHLARQRDDHVGRVLAGAGRKVERRQCQTRHIGAGAAGELQHLAPPLELREVSAAAADADDRIGMLVADAENHPFVQIGAVGRLSVGFARVEVHDGCTQFEGAAGVFDHLRGTHRDVRRHRLRRDHSRGAEVDEKRRIRGVRMGHGYGAPVGHPKPPSRRGRSGNAVGSGEQVRPAARATASPRSVSQ